MEAVEKSAETIDELTEVIETEEPEEELEAESEQEAIQEPDTNDETKESEAAAEVNEDRTTGPVQTTVEVKDNDGRKTIRISLRLEISFS